MPTGVLIQLAEKHFRGNDLVAADRLCDEVLAQDPRNADAIHLRGLILQRGGENASAVELFQQAISINPKAVGYHNNLGVALQALGRLEDAAAAYRQALQIKPNLVHVRTNLIHVLKEMDRPKNAAAHQAPAQREADACNDRGILLYQQGDLAQSLVAFRQAIALRPSLAAAWNNMGNVLLVVGDPVTTMSPCIIDPRRLSRRPPGPRHNGTPDGRLCQWLA